MCLNFALFRILCLSILNALTLNVEPGIISITTKCFVFMLQIFDRHYKGIWVLWGPGFGSMPKQKVISSSLKYVLAVCSGHPLFVMQVDG